MAIVDLAKGRNVWRTPELISTIALGPASYRDGDSFRPLEFAAGTILHEAASAALGLAYWFALSKPAARRRPVAAVVAIAVGSRVVWQYALMPWMAPKMNEETRPLERGRADAVFGAALGMLVGRRVQRARGPPRGCEPSSLRRRLQENHIVAL